MATFGPAHRTPAAASAPLLLVRLQQPVQMHDDELHFRVIDGPLRGGAPGLADSRRLPKGLTPQTLRTLCQWIDAHPETEFSTDDLAQAVAKGLGITDMPEPATPAATEAAPAEPAEAGARSASGAVMSTMR